MLEVFIFSYNRGNYLLNCLESVRRFAPGCRISVIDDDSTDSETCDILHGLPSSVEVLQPRQRTAHRHGGLYSNMQLALDKATPGQRALYIQDDMMLVRPLRAEDFQYIDNFFSRFPEAAFLNPVFLKGKRSGRDERITKAHSDFPVYFRHYPTKKNHRGIAYADAVIADTDRLRGAKWQFLVGEIANAEQAMQLFGRMGFMAHPFMMFLPHVTVYRGGRKTFGVRMAERRSGTQPMPFLPMSEAALETLFNRELSLLPHAERYLENSNPKVQKPFVYSAVNAHPLAYCLHKAEMFLRRAWR